MVQTPDVCVITPTIRNPEFVEEYVANARENGFDADRLFLLLVTEDSCDKDAMRSLLDRLAVDGAVFGGSERDAWFEEHGVAEYADLVPAASHAQTSFGLLYAWTRPAFEYCVFLDDDTAPHPEFDFFGRHLENLGARKRVERVASDEQWVNVLYQNYERHGLYPRGYPYSAMDEDVRTETVESDEIVASQGLWTNVPDLDAVRILMDGDLRGQAQTRTRAADFEDEFVVAEDQFLTVCSMNLAFEREVIPAFYQFPMDDNDWDVGRFDDIWSGVTLKKAADMLGKDVLTGFPLCEHDKAERSTFSDLTAEAPALELNEHFWRAVADAPDEAEDYVDAYEAIVAAVDDYDFSPYANAEFVDYAVEQMERWLEVVRELQPKPTSRVA